MKKHQLGVWLGLSAAIAAVEVAALSTPANAQNCSAYNSSVVTSVRQRNVPVGNILINNNYGPDPQAGSVSIRLYHSDAPDRIFSTWRFAGGESANLSFQGQTITIGGDWGIQIVFGNGVTSCIYPVADVGRFENGRYVVTASNIYRSNTPSSSSSSGTTGSAPIETSSEVVGERYEDMGGGWGGAKATLYRNGLLVIEGRAVSNANTSGTRTTVNVVGVDRRGNALFVSQHLDIPTACGRWDTCPSDRTGRSDQQINPEIAKYVSRLNIHLSDRQGPNVYQNFVRNIREACSSYQELPAGVRQAIASQGGFSGCN
ncbi:hypothetical protein MICAER10613_038830 [Microcystis aeruginosa]|jgi:hypothetical protein